MTSFPGIFVGDFMISTGFPVVLANTFPGFETNFKVLFYAFKAVFLDKLDMEKKCIAKQN